MLFHVSISAADPKNVADVMAELIGGLALPFPPVSDASWIALSDDAYRTAIEVYPLGTTLREADGDADAFGSWEGRDRYTPTHAAVGTELDMAAVLGIARREGWPAKYRKRGGMFGVIELWVEGRQMLEILTPDMQAEYRATTTIDGWRSLLASMQPA
ncbi:hypothetical protein [Sphingomonas crocodyli]|uniref:Uncharacterized protein n=1 Tax=Sphingomonas crocodyli TaxID=1979270 RepID=A0A437M7D4_9SPHN|nr:hypothetical protein [Sphingomonas crocodyli]RVT93582.1 hypothetical protein EOD43_06855 [Sphingomonas crocodyli]